MENINKLFGDDALDKAYQAITLYGMEFLAAVAIFVVGRWFAKWFAGLSEKAMTRMEVDPTLIGFVRKLVYVMLLTFVVMAAIAQLGIQTTSFIAVLGAAGFAIGLALQGSLANFAAGVLLIIFRPFKVGDFVEAAGISGVVEALQIFTTTLRTGDNKTIIVPNGQVGSGIIINYSTKDTRRVDLTFGVGYGDDLDHVRNVIKQVLDADDRILDDPSYTIAVAELADSSVNFAVRPWVKSGDYWPVFFDLNEAIKKRFDKEEISIPYPQQEVHVHQVAG
jgi:small conductance mechanosensitive channel